MRHFILVAVEHDDPAVAERAMAWIRSGIHRLARDVDAVVGDLVLRGDSDLDYLGFLQTEERAQVAAIWDRLRDRAIRAAKDRRPHSRACGPFCRGHGPACSRNCPTCGGRVE